MKARVWTAVVAIGVLATAIWLYRNRETIEWSNEVPHYLRGSWNLIEDSLSDNYGIRSIHLSRDVIVLDLVLDENEKESRRFPITKVSVTAGKGSEAGTIIVFYGPRCHDREAPITNLLWPQTKDYGAANCANRMGRRSVVRHWRIRQSGVKNETLVLAHN
jgi:hypothetical protein